MSEFKKNTATELTFCLVSASDGSAVTTGTTTCYYTLDGGTQATGNTATHEGNGQWSVAIDAAHINGDTAGFLMINSSAVPVNIHVNTTTKLVSELNDIAATAIVSAGAITTSSGAVSTVSTVTNGVTVTTNNDKTGYTASTVSDKTGYSISGTKTTLDALNDISATDVVSGGAITTSAGAVSNVTTVATTTTNTDMRGTDNAFLAANAPTNFSDLAITVTTGLVSVGTNNDKTGYTVSTVSDKTGYSISGTITTLDGLENVSAAEVNSEVVDALTVDTYGEPGQGAPGATVSLKDKISYIYKFLRNKKTSTSTTISVFNDAGDTVDQKSIISDDGSTYTEGEYGSGP